MKRSAAHLTRPSLLDAARRLARRQVVGTRLASLDSGGYPDAASIREFVVGLDASDRTYVAPGAAMSAILRSATPAHSPHQGMNVRGAAVDTPVGLCRHRGNGPAYAASAETTSDMAIGRISVDTPDGRRGDRQDPPESRPQGGHATRRLLLFRRRDMVYLSVAGGRKHHGLRLRRFAAW